MHRRARGEKELGDGTMDTADSALEVGVVKCEKLGRGPGLRG